MLNSPYAKAISVALLTVLATLTHWVITGEFDRAETATAISGAIASIVTYSVRNAPYPDGGYDANHPPA